MKITPYLSIIGVAIVAYPFFLKVIKPYVSKRILKRPKLRIKLKATNEGFSKMKWQITQNNTSSLPVYVYEVCWRFDIVIKNESNCDAYFPGIKHDLTLPYRTQISVLNHYVPIEAHSEEVLNVSYTILHQSTEDEKIIPKGIPIEFDAVRFLLEYSNEKGVKFFTLFNCCAGINSHHYAKPQGFGLT